MTEAATTPGMDSNILQNFAIETGPGRHVVILRRGDVEAGRKDVFCLEADIHRLEVDETTDEKPRCCEEDHRESYLDHD